ncbi:MAG TPA: M56 family metallopeptidase [Sedimentisphaerales bacterium]|nr:M56 family metallopeptidase [Sedimentisphaerales bacterium]
MEDYIIQITSYIWTQSWQIAVLVVVIAAASLALNKRSAHIRYLLWLIVLAKCLVPPLLTIPLAVLPQEKPAMVLETMDTSVAESPALPSAKPATAPLPTLTERPDSLTIRQCFGFGWFLCAAAFVLAAGIKALRTNLWLWRERKPLPGELQTRIAASLAKLEFEILPKVWLVDGIGQPFVWGLLRGSIYLPGDFVKADNAEHRRVVLGHELSHVQRFDAAVNILQVIAQAIFWFHPFVWWANKKIRAEREKCCDEMAIAHLDTKARDYSNAIVSTLINEYESTQPVPSLAVAGPVKNIEERIKTIMRPGKEFYKRPSLRAVIVLLLVALLTVPIGCALTSRAKKETAPELEEKPTGSLHQAAADGDIERVKSLIAKGVDINARDNEGRTALTLAKEKDHKEIVVLLRMHEAKEDTIKIELRLLLGPSNAREVKEFLERENLEPSQIPGDPNSRSYLLNAGQVEQLLELARLNAEYKYLMNPTLELLDGKTGMVSSSHRYSYVSGYSEPNRPSEEPKPIQDSVDIGDRLQLKPKLQPNSQDTMDVYFEFEISNITGYEKFMYKEKYPYEIPIIEKIAVATHYTVAAGQTLLLCGWKLTSYRDDGRTEKKEQELLVLITTQKVEPKNAQDGAEIVEVRRKNGEKE